MARRPGDAKVPHNRKPLAGATMRDIAQRRRRRRARMGLRDLIGTVHMQTSGAR